MTSPSTIAERAREKDADTLRWLARAEAIDVTNGTRELLNRCANELDRLSAPPVAGQVEGWQLVPVEPTAAMRQIGGETNCPTETLTSACDYAVEVYRAMLAAAPPPPDTETT